MQITAIGAVQTSAVRTVQPSSSIPLKPNGINKRLHLISISDHEYAIGSGAAAMVYRRRKKRGDGSGENANKVHGDPFQNGTLNSNIAEPEGQKHRGAPPIGHQELDSAPPLHEMQ
ncbi:hypothetical protein F4819DRAFT_484126 [Hypoxylon fuscum]|nr:hypothetical protein F4819DRAFT_484126 [Hypoxylon fuscum]